MQSDPCDFPSHFSGFRARFDAARLRAEVEALIRRRPGLRIRTRSPATVPCDLISVDGGENDESTASMLRDRRTCSNALHPPGAGRASTSPGAVRGCCGWRRAPAYRRMPTSTTTGSTGCACTSRSSRVRRCAFTATASACTWRPVKPGCSTIGGCTTSRIPPAMNASTWSPTPPAPQRSGSWWAPERTNRTSSTWSTGREAGRRCSPSATFRAPS